MISYDKLRSSASRKYSICSAVIKVIFRIIFLQIAEFLDTCEKKLHLFFQQEKKALITTKAFSLSIHKALAFPPFSNILN